VVRRLTFWCGRWRGLPPMPARLQPRPLPCAQRYRPPPRRASTPLKDLCLSKCRTPITFIMTSGRDEAIGALRMGLLHGAYCLGCCWLLFVILFPLGIMNIAAMAVITLIVSAEKTLSWGRLAPRATAAALVAYGAVTFQKDGAAMPTAAAQKRIVSVARIRQDVRKSARPFKGIICADISEFE